MKVLLLNLPVPDYYNDFQNGSNNLFCDMISAVIRKYQISHIEIVKFDKDIIDIYNSKSIIRKIIDDKIDVVGFSCYCWNLERNIYLSEKLRSIGIITIAGGSEVQLDNSSLINSDFFDIFVIGEGEQILPEILNNLVTNKNEVLEIKVFHADQNIDFNDYINFFTDSYNDYIYDGHVYLELERGCVFSCDFCIYGKNRKEITTITNENIEMLLDFYYSNPKVNDIYLLAPALNRNKKFFRNLLDKIIFYKKKYDRKISLFGELKAELLVPLELDLLEKAGFTVIEYGVQSLEISKIDVKTFSNKLIERNIKPIIDFIIGLPGDNYGKIIKTINYLEKENLLEYSNFYHLQILPSSDLKVTCDVKNYIYQKTPPYFLLKNESMDLTDIKNVYKYLEDKKDFSYRESFLMTDPLKYFLIKNKHDFEKLRTNDYLHSSAVVFVKDLERNQILEFYNDFLSVNNEIIHFLFIYFENEIDRNFLRKLKEVFLKNKNYYDKYRISIDYYNDELFSKKIIILTKPEFLEKTEDDLINEFELGFLYLDTEKDKMVENFNLLTNYYNEYDIETYVFQDILKILSIN